MSLLALSACRGREEPAGPAVLGRGGRPVIFVGLDGADWELLDGYMADGTMPNLAALAREGRPGVVRTIRPPLSPLVWTTMMTGTGPLVHRVLDFTRFNPQSGAREPVTSTDPTRTAGSYNNEGLLLREANRPSEAAAAFEHALALDPGNASAMWNLSDLLAAEHRDPDHADDLLVRAAGAGLPEGERRLLARTANYRRQGQPARVASLCERGADALPGSAPLRMMRGRFRVEADDCRGALADFGKAFELTPADPLA